MSDASPDAAGSGSRRVTPINGWVVDLNRLRRDHRGHQTFGATEVVDDLELPSAEVPDQLVTHRLDVDATGSDAIVTGTLTYRWRTTCRRCLEPVEGTATLDVQEIFQPEAVEGETWPIVEDHIDLEPLVREAVLLALPTSVVCRDDCTGPSEEYTVTVADESAGGDESDDEAPGDPRWAALDDLKFD